MAGTYHFIPYQTCLKKAANSDWTNPQVPITADLFFGEAPSFYLLKLRLDGLGVVKWDEVDGSNGYPHLYGNFGARDVVAVREFRRGEGQTWREVFEGEKGWLV